MIAFRDLLPLLCDWMEFWHDGKSWPEDVGDSDHEATVKLARFLIDNCEEDPGQIWRWVDTYLETGELPESAEHGGGS